MKRLCLSLCLLPLPAAGLPAQSCGTVQHYPTAKKVYHAQTYHAPYAYEAHDVVLVPLVQKVITSPDYYFSVRDYYRDAVQLELLQMQRELLAKGGGTQAQGQPQPAGGGNPLAALVQNACLRCHGGEQGIKGGVNLSNLSAVSPQTWAACAEAIRTGSMPKGGQRLGEAEAGLFAAAAGARPSGAPSGELQQVLALLGRMDQRLTALESRVPPPAPASPPPPAPRPRGPAVVVPPMPSARPE